METQTDNYDAVTRRGEEWYERLKAVLEPEHTGEAVAINTETGEYVTHSNWAVAGHELRKRFGSVPGFVCFIGEATEREFDLGRRLGEDGKL